MNLIEDYFLDDIEKRRYTFDEWNNKTEVASAYEKIPCRVDFIKSLQTDFNGQEFISNAMILMGYDTDIEFNDELKIDGQDYTVKKINNGRSFEGVHKEIWV